MDNVSVFCENYVLAFLELVNYDTSENILDIFEDDREILCRIIDEKCANDVQFMKELKEEYNKKVDDEIVDYIRENIYKENPLFFTNIIKRLGEMLNQNSNLALNLEMKIASEVNNLSFYDYYNNYLIALKFLIDNSEEDQQILKEE